MFSARIRISQCGTASVEIDGAELPSIGEMFQLLERVAYLHLFAEDPGDNQLHGATDRPTCRTRVG